MSHSFGHLAAYEPGSRVVDYGLPIRPRLVDAQGRKIQPILRMRCAGHSNPAYFNAVSKMNAQSGAKRRTLQSRVDSETAARNRRQDRILFPQHVIVGWEGIYDEHGQDVPYSTEACKEFLASIPDWMMDDIRGFAAGAENFLADEDPTDDEVREQAGN